MVIQMSKKGRRWENETAVEIYRQSEGRVYAWPAGYSGNGAAPAPDIFVARPNKLAGYELKRTDQDRFYVDADDLRQLLELAQPWFHVELVVKFSYREPVFIRPTRVQQVPDDPATIVERFSTAVPEVFRADGSYRQDDSPTSLRLDKPDRDAWPSAKTGDSLSTKIVHEQRTNSQTPPASVG